MRWFLIPGSLLNLEVWKKLEYSSLLRLLLAYSIDPNTVYESIRLKTINILWDVYLFETKFMLRHFEILKSESWWRSEWNFRQMKVNFSAISERKNFFSLLPLLFLKKIFCCVFSYLISINLSWIRFFCEINSLLFIITKLRLAFGGRSMEENSFLPSQLFGNFSFNL